MKPTIGVFFGSRSPEHDISIITAQMIIAGLQGMDYPVAPVYLSKRGEWLLGEGLGELKTFTQPGREINREDYENYNLDLKESRGRLVFKKKGFTAQTFAVDLAFPAFHGSYGEDGTIQGMFEIFGLPYVGCGVASSAITMDKILTKQFYQEASIPTVDFCHFTKTDWEQDGEGVINNIEKKIRYPVIVKPASLGSSIGIAKVKERRELKFAIEVALHYGERFLAEVSVENLMDLTVAVLGNDKPQASLVQESVFGDEVFSYEDKYLNDGGAQLGKAQGNVIIPARLPDKILTEVQGSALRIFKLFGCSGIARVDFLYDKKAKKYYANEVNTLPGTLYHHLWKASGIELPELLEKLIDLAIERHRAKRKVTLIFESDVLRRAHSQKLGLKRQKE